MTTATTDFFDTCVTEAVRQGERGNTSNTAATATVMLTMVEATRDPSGVATLMLLIVGHGPARRAALVALAATKTAERTGLTPTA